MSKLDELIKQYCPDGVEYKKVEEIFEILDNKRKPISKEKRESGIYPYYGANGIQDYVSGYIFDGDYLLIGEDGSVINPDNTPVVTWATGKFWVNNHAHILKARQGNNLRFFYHVFQVIDVSGIVRGTPPKINQENLRNIFLPLPPLPIQNEIADILDNFTKLTAELTAELTARRAQYEYYRDKLLTFDDETAIVKRIKDMLDQTCGGPEKVEYKRLSEVCSLFAGGDVPKDRFSKEQTETMRIPVISNGIGDKALYGYTDVPRITERCVTISARGTIGYVALRTAPFFPIIRLICAVPSNCISPDYLRYVLETVKFSVPTSGIPQLTVPEIGKYIIPVPPLSVQKEIVSFLDKFNTLTTDISTGLPAEISLRQKQYEHYRDRLLNFNGGGYTMNEEMNFVKFRTLPEISVNCDKDRKPVTKCNRNSGQFPYYGASGIVDYVDNYLLDGDYLLVSEDGANLVARNTPIAFSVSGKCWVNNHAHVLKFSTYELRRYVEYYLNSIDLSKYISGGAQPKLNQDNLNKISIPIPPMEWIKKIVNALDKLFLLCESLSEGLPAEIEARKKQYKYYRDKLLDFKERKA